MPKYSTIDFSLIKGNPSKIADKIFGILRCAEKYSPEALERFCKDSVLAGKCNYSYVSNTVSTYHIEPSHQVEKFYKTSGNASGTISGRYKDDDSKYSLKSLMERQEKEVSHHE